MIYIFLPVKNESATIAKTTGRIVYWCKKNIPEFQIVFINDHSTDDTENQIRKIGFEYIRLINNNFDPGKGSALKFGFIKLSNEIKDDDLILFLDGDGQIDISETKVLINMMNLYNSEVVIGSKRHNYSISEYNTLRSIVSKTYNFIIRNLFSLPYHDTQCGIKLFKKQALLSVINKVTVKKFAFDLELLVALRAKRLRIVEAPVRIEKQLNSGSVNIKNIFQTFIDTLKICIRSRKNFYV